MRMRSAGVLLLAAAMLPAQSPKYGVGRPPSAEEIRALGVNVAPDGAGLPEGSGTAVEGREVFSARCAKCHGANGEGGDAPALVGGQGTLNTPKPRKTVGSFWPYAPTVWDYIQRAMPFNQPGVLSHNQVYAVVAHILHLNGIVAGSQVLNAQTLPKVKMPNRDGFVADPRPDVGRASLVVAAAQAPSPKVSSHVMLMDADGKFREVIYSADRLIEAPNWSPDGKYLLVNSEGRLWRLPAEAGEEPKPVPTGSVTGINNDHGISSDGKWFAFSAGHIYLAPSTGGQPRQVTSQTPSYYHGWSPDGSTLAFCGRRGDNFDLYAISRDGGAERRLTVHPGHDDGPDYTPDGRWIYFNSDRSGSSDIWRIPAQGAGPNDARAERITNDEWEDWFPHPSPDGKWVVFLSYEKGTKGHPRNQNVVLRRLPLAGGPPEIINRFFGGQGSINVNSWAPDSKRFACIRYSLLP